MYKIVRTNSLDPVSALIDLEDAINLFIANDWYVVGTHHILEDHRQAKPHYLASVMICNDLTAMSKLTGKR